MPENEATPDTRDSATSDTRTDATSDTSHTATLDSRFSDGNATAASWPEAVEQLEQAEIFWLTTVRRQGRPHVTPLLGVWQDDALHFCTGPGEQKAQNLVANPQVALTTGSNALNEGFDLVVEGEAVQETDDGRLRRLAEAYEKKYGKAWHFDVRDGAFHGDGGRALVFRVAPGKVLGFGRGVYSQTRWTF